MSKIKVCIDPGHGGLDSGAVGQQTVEKDITLKISLEVKKILEQYEAFQIFMTREDDRYVSLASRVGIANNIPADIFISIHANGSTNPFARGTEVYCFRKGGIGEQIASKIVYELSLIPYYSLQQCDIKSSINMFIVEEKEDKPLLIKLVNKEEVIYELENRGLKEANFYVLKNTIMPAVLVETAFITNPEEEKILIERYNEFANAIATGILKYYGIAPKPKTKTWEDIQREAIQWAIEVGLLKQEHDINTPMTIGLWAVLEQRKRHDLKWYN